jgi:hypothetical protein
MIASFLSRSLLQAYPARQTKTERDTAWSDHAKKESSVSTAPAIDLGDLSDEILTPQQLSQLVGKSTDQLATERHLGRGPAYVKYGKKVYYLRSDVVAFLTANRREPGSRLGHNRRKTSLPTGSGSLRGSFPGRDGCRAPIRGGAALENSARSYCRRSRESGTAPTKLRPKRLKQNLSYGAVFKRFPKRCIPLCPFSFGKDLNLGR